MPDSLNWGHEPDEEMGLLHTENDGNVIKKRIPALSGNYMEYYDGIFASIRQNKPLPVTATEGANVIKVIEASLKSNKETKVIKI